MKWSILDAARSCRPRGRMARDNVSAVRDTLIALMDEIRQPSVTFKAKNEYLQELKKVSDVTGGKYDLSSLYPPDEFAKTCVLNVMRSC